MALSAEIVHLMAEEEKKLSIDFIHLHPSRNYKERATDRSHRSTSESEEICRENVTRPDAMLHKLDDPDQVSTLRRAWQEFHKSNRYRFFDEFYYKNVFCTYENIRQISDQSFLTLISDRSFLFPEHSDQAQDVEYPAIYMICKVDQKRINKPDNIDEVRREGIVPTTGHLQAYERLCANRKRLTETIERRKRNLQRYRMRYGADNIQDGTPIFTIRFGNVLENDTSVSESSPAGSGEMARKLSCLFYNYVKAISTRGYRTGLSHYLKSEKTDWEKELRHVYEYLLREAPDWNPALVFFCLFTEYTTPLASHRLKKFDFALKSAAKRAEEPIGQVQLTLSRKYECQIMLYDHLLDLLLQTASPEEISYAKFEFYARTRYQWYAHYRLPPNSHTASEYDPSFHMAPDFGDGVDELGEEVDRCDQLAKIVGKLAYKVDKAMGGDGTSAVRGGQEQCYYRLDLPFRQWLLTINPEAKLQDQQGMRRAWRCEAKNITLVLGRELVDQGGTAALIGRTVTEKIKNREEAHYYCAPKAFNQFLYELKQWEGEKR